MPVHQTVSTSKQAPSRREVTACSRVTHAKLPNTPPLNQESMALPKQPLLELIFSPTRNVKIPAQHLTTSKFPTWANLNMKLLMLEMMILLTWSSQTEPWNNWSYQLMKNWMLTWRNCGMKTTKKLKFSTQWSQPREKKRSFQEELRTTIDTHQQSLFLIGLKNF